VGTAIIMVVVLVPLAWFGFSSDGPFLHVLSGHLFTGGFDRIHAGSVMDQPTIGKWYVLFGVFSAAAVPYMAVARWISDRRTRVGYWAYAGPAAGVCVCLLIILTMPFYWLLQYIHEMGFTRLRVYGLAYGVGGYLVILGFLYWAARRPRRRRVIAPNGGAAAGGRAEVV